MSWSADIDANASVTGNQAFTYVGNAKFGASDPFNPFGIGETPV